MPCFLSLVLLFLPILFYIAFNLCAELAKVELTRISGPHMGKIVQWSKLEQMLMIIDSQGWGRIHNHFSPGSTAFLYVFTLSLSFFFKNWICCEHKLIVFLMMSFTYFAVGKRNLENPKLSSLYIWCFFSPPNSDNT